jgi:hypothetical protein
MDHELLAPPDCVFDPQTRECTFCHQPYTGRAPIERVRRNCPAQSRPQDPGKVATTYRDAARERWTEQLHRPLDQVLAAIDRLAAEDLLPICGCPDTIQAALTDLLTPGWWRKQWAEYMEHGDLGGR